MHVGQAAITASFSMFMILSLRVINHALEYFFQPRCNVFGHGFARGRKATCCQRIENCNVFA